MTTIDGSNISARRRPASFGRLVMVLVLLVFLLGILALLAIGLNSGKGVPATGAASRANSPARAVAAPVNAYYQRPTWNPTRPLIMKEGINTMEMTPAAPRGPTWAELAKVYRMVQPVATYLARYDSVKVAHQAHYRRNLFRLAPNNNLQVNGRHVHVQRDFTHFPNSVLGFSPKINLFAPRTLVYKVNSQGPRYTFAGVMYEMPGTMGIRQLEQIFPPSMAMWHQHINLCIGWDGATLPWHDAATCYKNNGAQFNATSSWMLHLWVGLPYGKGLFDVVPGSDPTTAAAAADDQSSLSHMTAAVPGPRMPVIMVDGAREMKMLPLSGRPPTWLDVVHTYAALHPAQPTVLRFADPAAARRAGYLPAPALYAAGPGTHYLNPTYLAAAQHGRFDPTRPPLLVYSTAQGHAALAGVMYVLPQRLTPTDLARVFPSSLASWQRMLNTCVVSGAVVSVYDAATCAAQHGQFTPSTGWMVHAWIGQAGDSAIFDMDLQQRSAV